LDGGREEGREQEREGEDAEVQKREEEMIFQTKTEVGFYGTEVWQSVLVQLHCHTLSDATSYSIKLIPLQLNEQGESEATHLSTRGLPAIATRAQSVAILHRLAALSLPFGTALTLEDSVEGDSSSPLIAWVVKREDRTVPSHTRSIQLAKEVEERVGKEEDKQKREERERRRQQRKATAVPVDPHSPLHSFRPRLKRILTDPRTPSSHASTSASSSASSSTDSSPLHAPLSPLLFPAHLQTDMARKANRTGVDLPLQSQPLSPLSPLRTGSPQAAVFSPDPWQTA
jgi:hypothetical protein